MMRKAVYAVAILSFCIFTTTLAWSADKKVFPSSPAIAADKGSHYLVSSPQGLSMDVYDPQTQNILYSIRFSDFVPDFKAVSALAIDDINLLAACAVTKKNSPGAIYLFDLPTNKIRGIISGLPATAVKMALSGNSRYLAFGTDNHQGLFVYKFVTTRKIASASATGLSDQEKEALRKLAYLEKDLLDPSLVLHDPGYKGNITALAFDGRENLAVSADDGSIRLYNASLKQVKSIDGKNGAKPSCLRFSPDNTKLAVGYTDKAVIDVFKASDLSYLYSPDTSSISMAFSSSIIWSEDGRFMYASYPTAQKNETTIYKWRQSGEGGRSHLSTVTGDSRIEPVAGGGLLYTDPSNGINLLDKRYGTVYNEWGNVWAALEHKYGYVTYEIGGDYSNSEGASVTYWFPISRLKWPINAFMAEIGSEIHLGKRLEIKGSISHNITSNLGNSKVEDSDWVFDPAIYGDTPDIYSESNSDFKGYGGDIQARFWILDRHYSNNSSFSLGIGAGFSYQHYDWEASNVDQWSPSGYYGNSHFYRSGLIGTYKSELFMPYLELAIRSKFGKADITGTIGGSPYLWARDEDNHLLRYKLMKTDAHGYSLKAGIQANYNFTEHWFAGLRFNLLYFHAKGTQKGYQYADLYEDNRWYLAGYQWDIEHEINSFQLDSMLIAGFRF